MGAVIRVLKRSKSTVEILEDIDKEIELRRKLRQHNLHLQRKYAVGLVLYSAMVYIGVGIFLVAYYFPTLQWMHRIFCAIPFLLFPPLIWMLRKLLHWYFVRRIENNDSALQELKEKKKSLLEEVMEKETYKKAKEILEKFDPEQFKKLENANIEESAGIPLSTPLRLPPGTDLRRRPVGGGGPLQQAVLSAPQLASTPSAPQLSQMQVRSMMTPMLPPHLQGHPGFQQAPRLPMPRHVPPRERSAMDRLVEYLVGDGPNQRYALICNQCLSHNGMALKEEFEYLSFRCCYCYGVNHARKQRPNAPLLELKPALREADSSHDEELDDDEGAIAGAANGASESVEEDFGNDGDGEGVVSEDIAHGGATDEQGNDEAVASAAGSVEARLPQVTESDGSADASTVN